VEEVRPAGHGRAQAKMTLQPHHCNALGTVHGGAIFTLADFAFAAASNSHGTVAVALPIAGELGRGSRGVTRE
jgi:acyl-CoA thioesterase